MLPNIDSLDTYGGPMADAFAVVDPTTDESAKFRNWYAMNVAMLTHTGLRAMRSFVGVNGANPTDPLSGFVHDALWGSAPSVKPTVVRFSEGVYDVTFPATVDTELASEAESVGGGTQAQIALNLRRAVATVECSDGTLRHASAQVTGPNTVRVRCWTAAGALDDLPGQTITVLVW